MSAPSPKRAPVEGWHPDTPEVREAAFAAWLMVERIRAEVAAENQARAARETQGRARG